jgi:hypothetical protein
MKRILLIFLCAIPLLPHETLTTTVLFDREIVRILDKHCVMCHAENGPSFPLETFDQTWLKKREIHSQTIARHMPPWAAVPGYGQFANDNSLTLRESQFIVSWVEGLGPRNSGTVFLNVTGPDAARPAEIRAHNDAGHWQLGEPSTVFKVPANNVIDLGLKTASHIRALEYMPSDRRMIRSAFFKVQETGQWIGSWTPWYGFMALPNGRAFLLPAGSHIVAEIQYKGNQRAVDQGSLGLFFADARATAMLDDLVLRSQTPAARVRATSKLIRETTLVLLRPEFTAGAKSIEVTARKPNGATEVLLFAKDPSPEWSTPYVFKTPVTLPAGTEISVTVYYAQTGSIRLTATRY